MKKLFSLLLALLMASSSAAMIYAADDAAASPAAETADRVLGDINNDGTVNIQDALDLYRYTMLPESYTIDYPGILDFVMDDSIDISDAVMLFQYSMLPETFPIVWGNESEYPIEHLSINGVDISEYVITTNGSTSSTVAYAASELQKYIELSTGVNIPVVAEGVEEGTKRILIDDTLIVDNDSIFRHFTDEDGLVIAGDSVRGAMYSVYHFLEKKLNWRFFSFDTEVCYDEYYINLTDVDYTYEHQYMIRDIYYYNYNRHPEFCVKRYVNGDSRDMSQYGGSICYTPLGIHNFSTLCKIYNGNGSSTNPCLNSRRHIMLNSLETYMKKYPDTKVIQVSQNDTDSRCHCEECQADDEYYGAPSGTIVETLNWILEKLNKKYPDLKIVTFAYHYSFRAPENIVCNPNLVIEITPIDMCHQHGFTDANCNILDNEFVDIYGESATLRALRNNQDTIAEIEKWSKICDKFYMYDYGADFRYYYSSFPDVENLWDYYTVFNDIGAWGYINLSNPHVPSVEFGELRTYLIMKLMEDTGMTKEEFDNHINEFMQAYYGAGWEYIREYYDLIHKLANEHDKCFGVYNSPEQMYGDHAFAPYSAQLVEIFDRAEELVADDETSLYHVRLLRISMDYLRIGAIHYEEMNSGDEARVQSMIAEVEALYNKILEFGVDYITEYGKIDEITDFTQNPRTWANGDFHKHYYAD